MKFCFGGVLSWQYLGLATVGIAALMLRYLREIRAARIALTALPNWRGLKAGHSR